MSSKKARQWDQNIANQKASGLTIQQWCVKNDILPHQFYYWKSKLRSPTEMTRNAFTEMRDENKSLLFFECNGIRLFIDQSCDPSFLKQCLKALREN